MIGQVLVLRPEPGASATAARAKAKGLEAVVAPLFTIRPLAWDAPDPAEFDAILLTSANAAREAGLQLGAYLHLPCHAVGEATAAAATEVGFTDVRTGPSDGAAALAAMSGRVLHLCGREHLELTHEAISVERRIVYAADAVAVLPAPARNALAAGAIALLHSPRAAATLASFLHEDARRAVTAAAISDAAATALGPGWACVAVAARPRDEALLELAAELCQKT
ncbi:MAG TPA: uroporphyrinogen-III synthase [Allosphingosinicella sp.]|nr:uroporphyrinogen-III synthase [Allosphingosinicella sp.]